MNTKLNCLIFQCLLFISLNVSAHQPDLSSTILVEQDDNTWVLQIRAALTAFEYEVEYQFGKSSYTSPEEFQGLVLKHLQENLSIQFNQTDRAILKDGIVKLGHETTVSYNVFGIPETLHYLNIKNSSFSNIARNQSALIVLKKGFSKDQFVLDKNNEHTVNLRASNSKFETVTLVTSGKYLNAFTISILTVLVFSIIYFALKTRESDTSAPMRKSL